jgi:predicted MFS family arabinose efflux permease
VDSQVSSDGARPIPRRAHVLAILTLVMVFNYIDRILVAVLAEPIKTQFGISDFQLGLLGGPAFAFLYSTLSLPIARLADRTSRVNIIATTVALWSMFTALCGVTTQYWQLLLARVGTGIGEAGCTPAAMSLVADYFPIRQRSTALATFIIGAPIGTLVAALTGGWIAQIADWHLVFLALGMPGIVLAIIFKMIVKEPLRSGGDGTEVSMLGAVKALLSKRAFAHTLLGSIVGGTTMLAFVQFLNAYLSRVRGLPPLLASTYFGLLAGIGIGVGTFLGGYLPDRLSARYPSALAIVGAVGMLACAPLYWLGLYADNQLLMLVLMLLASICLGVFIPVICSLAQTMAPSSMRATAVAMTLFSCQFFGGVFGPPLLGLLSDSLSSRLYVGPGSYHIHCSAHSALISDCASARGHGLDAALAIWIFGFVWSAAHFFLAARTLQHDRVEPLVGSLAQ